MIRLIHKYNRSIAIVFLFVAVCFALSGVGIDVLHDGNRADRAAILVNERSFTEAEVARVVRNNESRYRKMYGDNFDQYAKMFGINVVQQSVDQMIDTELLNQEAAGMGFASDDEAVRRFILEEEFAGMPYDETRFRGMLKAANLTYRDFSRDVKEGKSREALLGVLRDSAYVSRRDAENQLVRQETSYSVLAAIINVSDLLASAPAPTEEQLKAFYDQNASRFEVPPQASYTFIELAPSAFEKDVQVSEDDIGIYYTDNARDFTIPEQVRVSEIKVSYPKNADDKAKADVKEKAKQAREEALAGKVFAELVAKYSSDAQLKAKSGDRGWISRGAEHPSFDKAAFSTEAGAVSEIIETDESVSVIKVEEKKPSTQKPLASVRAEIEATIRKNEAPSYAKAKADEVLKTARRDGKSLSEVAGLSGLSVKESGGMLAAGSDPAPALTGLTEKVIALQGGDRVSISLVEVGDTSALVQIKEFKDASLAPFAEVREKIVQVVKAQEAQKLADARAKEILVAAQAAPQNFAADAKQRGAKVVGPVKVTRANPTSTELPELSQPILRAVFSLSTPQVINQQFPSQNSIVLASVTAIEKPDLSKGIKAEDLEKYRLEAREQAYGDAIQSALAYLKSSAKVDVDPVLLSRQ